MCGIIGYFNKTGAENQLLGEILLGMLNALACRGPDSAGVALYGTAQPNQLIARVKLGNDGGSAERTREIETQARKFGAHEFAQNGDYLRLTFPEKSDLKPFLSSIESVAPDVEVVSVGRSLEIVKQVGSPSRLEQTFHISEFRGGHGIGHTRLSTESVVDLSHSQPFWGHGYRRSRHRPQRPHHELPPTAPALPASTEFASTPRTIPRSSPFFWPTS